MKAEPLRLGVVTTHPIQYQSPLWRAMVDEGLDVEVLYLNRHGTGHSVDLDFGRVVKWDNDVLAGFRHRFVTDRSTMRPGSPWSGLTPNLVSAIVRGSFDALIVMGYATAGYLLSALTAAATRVPLYLRGETISSTARRALERGRRTDVGRRVFLQGLLRLYSGAFPIGRDSEQFYLELGMARERLTLAPYGVDNSWFRRRPEGEIQAVREELGVGARRRLVLQTGKLIARKRPQQAVAVAAELRRRGVDAGAAIVGSGPLEAAVRATMTESDVFVGFVNQSRLPALYAAADVLLVPSTYETWGLVVNEALAAGTPVVGSPNVPGAVELASQTDGHAVQVVSSVDARAWADACEVVLADDREVLAKEAAAAIGPYDVVSTAKNMAQRIRADLG